MFRILYKHNYLTGVRLRAAARIVRRFLDGGSTVSGPPVLDVGSCRYGVAAHLPGIPVHGADSIPPGPRMAPSAFIRADIKALPYCDRAFPVVCCIDVLEHLPIPERSPAIGELVRVARHLLVIACPHGATARECDGRFLEAFRARGSVPPDCLIEHQRQAYPDAESLAEQVRESALALGRSPVISLSYCEPISITRFLRGAAIRSPELYAFLNIVLGLFAPILPNPKGADGYRMVMSIEFT
jgi:hypothetical protein